MNKLEILKELRKEKNVTQIEIAKALNISQKAYSYYERGEREPSIGILISLANFFNVTIDYMLGQEKNKYFALTEEEISIIHKYQNLSPSNKAKIEERMDVLLEEQENKKAESKETA